MAGQRGENSLRTLISVFIIVLILIPPTNSSAVGKTDWIGRESPIKTPKAGTTPDIIITGTYLLNDIMEINAGKWIRIENATFTVNSTYDGEFGILVHGSGKLELINSTIRRADERGSFFFKAEAGSNLIIYNTDIEKCGYNGGTSDEMGASIGTDNALISDSRFNGSIYALSVVNSSPTIFNCTFENSSRGIYSSASHAEITNCRFFDNTFGYMAVSSGDRIENSTFTGNIYGIKAQSASVHLSNISLTGGTYGAYFSYSSPALENLSVTGAEYGIYAYSSTMVLDKNRIRFSTKKQ